MSLPDSKIIGARNLMRSPAFGPGNLTPDVHSVQELRGSINHWACASRIWPWLAEPINQIMPYVDRNQVWIRRNDAAKWESFWAVVQFARDLTTDLPRWGRLFTGEFT